MAKASKTGYIVSYKDANGIAKTGHVYYGEGKAAGIGKVAIWEVDADHKHVKQNGREVVVLRSQDEIKQIGYLS